MVENLSNQMFSKLGGTLLKTLHNFKTPKKLTKSDVNVIMEQVQNALIEADVTLSVTKKFIQQVKEEALGEKIQHSDKENTLHSIIERNLVQLLSDKNGNELNLNHFPCSILMCGIQGSGKTTTSAKLGYFLNQKHKVLLTSLDIYRPFGREQLEIVSKKENLLTLPIIQDEKPLEIVKRSIEFSKENKCDIVLYDTAGRLGIDEKLMNELKEISNYLNPVEKLFISDSALGNDSVSIIKEYHEKIGMTGIILTKMDGDTRGGSAISMKSTTGVPIKFIGTGEKIQDFDKFNPKGMASRILGKGDVQALIDKSLNFKDIDQEKAQEIINKIAKKTFNFEDYLKIIHYLSKMGSLQNVAQLIPGFGVTKDQLSQLGIVEENIQKHEKIISQMSKEERSNPTLVKNSSTVKVNAAKKAGVQVLEVNQMIKQFDKIQDHLGKFLKIDPSLFGKSQEEILNNPEFLKLAMGKEKLVRSYNRQEMFNKNKN